MSLYGYKKKGGLANWMKVKGAKGVRSPEKKKRLTNGQRKRIGRSKAWKATNPIYVEEAREFVRAAIERGETCPVVEAIRKLRNGMKYGHPICARLNEVHHRFGRLGELLEWQPGWMAVSKQGHRWIHSNIEEAMKRGWIGPKGTWNDFEKAKASLAQ